MTPQPSFHSLHHDLAHEVLKHLGTQNVAKLRTASKSVRNFGKNGAECRSAHNANANVLQISGTAITRRGNTVNFLAVVGPRVMFRPTRSNKTLDYEIEVSIGNATTMEPWADGTLMADRLSLSWHRNDCQPERFVVDQVIGCISREIQNRADSVASIMRAALVAMVTESKAPRTSTGIREAASKVRLA